MRSRFRSALMWLLLLALPLQGFAATAMVNCGPNHHRMMTGAMAGPGEAHEHRGAGQHHHEMASADNSGEARSMHHLDKFMKFKCSACAACCMGAALPTAAITLAPFPPAMTPGSFVPSTRVGFVTDGPDRPPRLSFV